MVALATLVGAMGARAAQFAPPYRGADARLTTHATPAHVSAPASPNRYQRARIEAMSRATAAVTDDTLRVLALQVQFADSLMGGQPGSNRSAVRDSTWFANELIHTEQYFRGASRNRFTFEWTLEDSLYSLPRGMGYYGADSREEERVVELAQTLIDLADANVDFSLYDHVFIIHAGAGQETDINADSPNQIWSSFYDRGDIREIQDDDASLGLPTDDLLGGDPFFVDNFSIVPSHASQDFATVGTLGIWTFEIGSRIGLLPLFDSTPNGAPDSQGVGNFCLMAYGIFNVNGFVPAFPCAFNRILAGWLDPVVVDPDDTPAAIRLADVNTGADADTLCVKVPITDSEYYLVVNRVHDENFDSLFTFADADSDLVPDNTESLDGAEFDFFLTDLTNPFERRFDPRYGFNVLFRYTGSGVYVWHVDERVVIDAARRGYLPDDYAARKGVDLEEADGVQDMDRPGSAAFALGSHFDSYRTGDGNNPVFGPDTDPASGTNAGAETGITIETLTGPAFRMRVSIGRLVAYNDTRARWSASARNQPATVVNLDGAGDPEIVTLGDNAGVFVLDESGREVVDPDANPSTIAPFIAVPNVTWIGPPAFANLDGAPDIEIVAGARNGDVYVWKADGTPLAGAPFAGLSGAAAPVIVDVGDAGLPEILVASGGTGTQLRFIDATGAPVDPPAAAALWPAPFDAQILAPLAIAGVSGPSVMGVVACGVDTTTSRVVVQWTPLDAARAPWEQAIAIPSGWDAASFVPTAPAVGDVDHDGDDEIVIATPDGSVVVFDMSSTTVTRESGVLRARYPSAPALGDVDDDGTLEIAIWDAEYMYLLKSNARPMLEWPRAIRDESAGAAPTIRPHRELESPLLADIDGGTVDVVFPLDDGTLAAFRADGRPVASFPRPGPAEAGATPTLTDLAPGSGSLVVLGAYGTLDGVDTVVDTLAHDPSSSLSIQSLSASVTSPYWIMARADLARTGRVVESVPLATSTSTFDEGSFIIYPNPVMESTVHARITTNARARVRLSIHTLEGQEATVREFDVNPNGLVDTPFDEAIDVSGLKSGIYFMRLEIDGPGGSGAVYKTFAIRR
ncbi:MAG TPA: FG-GAP-like repeat-containing protein [Candidatus Krumholzibacteria bacterium]|nr:FG-GAP-like repeat-containing protein [Candidatus Krumholzibacteria bacterium]